MEPALREGDWLVVLPARRPRRGDVVVVRDPGDERRLLVKRVSSIDGDSVVITGDHAGHSRDSGEFGAVSLSRVVGRAAFRYAPLGRIGPV
jgi:signal peptidase I